METTTNRSETRTSRGFDFAYEELSSSARKIVVKCHSSTMLSPLQYCRMLQENATGEYLTGLMEAEAYLINEF